ncbi:MAG: T9SS type A sorting domain-containing protein [Bacteroidota bacterium]|nr:T9SS type A sorting domain-containing protein [Bacteroidota bacterium]
MRNILLICVLFLASADLLFSQNDFFPLAPGNYFTYQYQQHSYITDNVVVMQSSSDTGIVKFEVIDSTSTDSTIEWNIRETFTLTHRQYDFLAHIDTVYICVYDSVKYLREYKQLNHRMHFNSLTPIWNFPTRWDMINVRGGDVSRYPSGDSLYVIFQQYSNNPYIGMDSLVFRVKKGLQSVKSSCGKISNSPLGDNWNAVLIDSHITGIGTKNNEYVVKDYALMQNYPNPFNPNTTISYQLPKSGQVTIKVYDVLGNEVRTLVNEYKSAGQYSVNFDAGKLSSGMYIYRITAGGYTSAKKMTLIK